MSVQPCKSRNKLVKICYSFAHALNSARPSRILNSLLNYIKSAAVTKYSIIQVINKIKINTILLETYMSQERKVVSIEFSALGLQQLGLLWYVTKESVL